MKKMLGLCLAVALLLSCAIPSAAAPQVSAENVPPEAIAYKTSAPQKAYPSQAQAVQTLRREMKKRTKKINLTFAVAGSYPDKLCDRLFRQAVKHTGDPAEGDYLLWHYNGYKASRAARKEGGKSIISMSIDMKYLTTAKQEKTVDQTVKKILKRMNLKGKSDYQKAKAIYNWICAHVKYDYSGMNSANKIRCSAYGALVNHYANCQGFANLFYRMALEAGLDTRILVTKNTTHAWNIVKIGKKYYNVDATWDAGRAKRFFLKGSKNFPAHERGAEYTAKSFQKAYPMAAHDYKNTAPAITKVTAGKKSLTVKWKQQTCNGYQVQFATNKSFKNAKTVTVKSPFTPWLKISGLKSKAKTYVRVRTYYLSNVMGVRYTVPTDWSAAKAVVVK